MKKIMIMVVAILMIGGSVSAHGYGGYYHGGYCGPRVVARPYYAPYYAPAPAYYGGYGYRPAVVYHPWGGFHGCYRGRR